MPSPRVRPIPSEFGSIVVQLVVHDAAAAIEFYKRAFGAGELFRNQYADDSRVFHCELLIDGGRIMVQDEFPERRLVSPRALGGSPTTIHLYVADAEATYQDAIEAGATAISPVEERFWGVVSGALEDPYGHRWIIATRVEDLGPDEIAERAAAAAPGKRLPIGKG
jgi:PhnB protein